jgi:hypothetical protein
MSGYALIPKVIFKQPDEIAKGENSIAIIPNGTLFATKQNMIDYYPLPRIRQQVERDVALPRLLRDKELATVVSLLDTTYIRIGNAEYARTNQSYGLTMMHDRHVKIDDTTFRS